MTLPSAADIVAFWRDAGPDKWFAKDEAFDAEITRRFVTVHEAAAAGRLGDWEETPEGVYALLILLDQFPRNLFRNSAHAYATDGMARRVARHAVQNDFDQEVDPVLRPFFYLPFEHSEDPEDQALSVTLTEAHRDATGDEDTLKWAVVHRDIIARFGRFPHRNRALGRETTVEEQAFLDDGGFAG